MSGLSERGVILCKCNDKVSKALPVDEVCRFLGYKKPGLPVVIADNLCKPEVLAKVMENHKLRPIVIGACSQLSLKLPFWEEPGKNGIDAYSSRIVDLIGEINSWSNPDDILRRVALLLLAQIERQEIFTGTPPGAVKLQFIKPQGKTSRRKLFSTLLPQHQLIPHIERDKCAGMGRCTICRKSCPFSAIVIDKQISIDKTRCRGCGICTAVCPHQAISYPAFSFEQLNKELEGLLVASGEILEPRIIAIACQSCPSSSSGKKISHFNVAPNILSIEIPCVDMALPLLILRAFDLGAQGVALISKEEGCRFDLDCSQWQGKFQFLQHLFEQWGIEPERIKTLQYDQMEQQLIQFSQSITMLPASLPRSSEPTLVTEGALVLPSIISGLTKKLAPYSSGTVSTGQVPFGRLRINTSNCTACGLCVNNCPTEALKLVIDEDLYQFYFHPQACVGCGQCVDICPEACLQMENILELGQNDSPPETLFETEVMRCLKCREPMAPAAMADKLRNKLGKGEGLTSQLAICTPCKLKSISGIPASFIGV